MKKAAADKAPAKTQPDAPGFEDALKRLTAIVERLESGELSLEQSLSLFEEGTRLSRSSQAQLDAAEKRVEELLAIDAQGLPVVRELDPE
ncbi:MAG TPA: exodeoxyribonuclease VII small subunit [Polyangiaceae bacterium]|jgi:exodeoxyribonuclease VII small subunit|nr:exodeoxyribonuclease VII small subunit [Polyangiaceae bacterium]